MTSYLVKQQELQQAFKELSVSLSQQQKQSRLKTNSKFLPSTRKNENIRDTAAMMTTTATTTTTTTTTTTQALATSKSTPGFIPNHLKKAKSCGTFNNTEHPYSPFMDVPSCTTTLLQKHERERDTLLQKQDEEEDMESSGLFFTSCSSSSTTIHSGTSRSSSSTSSSHYSGDSIPSTPTTFSSIVEKDRRMRRIPSSNSSLSFTTSHSSMTKSKPSVKWDWTIEEDTFGNSNLHQLAIPPHLREHRYHNNHHSHQHRLVSTLETVERDRYGFKKPVQWIKLDQLQQFEHRYQATLAHQNEKWTQLLAEHNHQFPSPNARLRRYVRKGIPHKYRGKAWMHYSGAKSKMEAHPGLYASLLDTAIATEEQNEYAEIIRRDLHRTFPDNTHFACAQTDEHGNIIMDIEGNPKLVSLKHILYAFSIHSPQIGYCQSLNYLVGLFLLFTESDEEAFWLLVATVHDYCPPSTYDVTMEGSNIDQVVLMMMVYERMPSIWNKLANGKCFWECEQTDSMPSITLVTSHWFLTLFINIMPIETVLRIWDCFFMEGCKVLFRVALTIIKMNEHHIWAMDDPIDIFPLLQNMPRRLVDCHRFIERVFDHSGVANDITYQEIDRKRSLFKDRRKQRRQEKFKQLMTQK